MTSGSWTHIGYAQEIRFGPGRVAEAPQLVEALRAERVLLVTTQRGSLSAAGKKLAAALSGRLAAVFDEARPHVPQGVAKRAFAQARAERIDAIVSLGGGSCADLGKAVCHFAEQARGGVVAVSAFDRPALPHIAIPTTYSGAEVTPFYGMLDEATHRKSGAAGPTLAPAGVIYDPETTLDLPPRASAETGMNALAHCIEAAWSPSRTPEAEAIAYSGAARIFYALPQVIERPHDLQARTELLAGALLGGRCLQNASMGVHHGLAQMVGGRTGIAHGLANALILAHAVRFNQDAVPEVIARLAVLFGRRDGDAGAAIDELRARIGLPAHLAECGVGRDDIEAVAEASGGNATIAKNPKPVRMEDARAILLAAF
ncbi:MAG TPA: iron-containing alcohol dehydrogenase family protein [Steroidobacteraceae bacterium]